MDCDRVLVMHAGKVVEFDSPVSLCQADNSIFHTLAGDQGQWDDQTHLQTTCCFAQSWCREELQTLSKNSFGTDSLVRLSGNVIILMHKQHSLNSCHILESRQLHSPPPTLPVVTEFTGHLRNIMSLACSGSALKSPQSGSTQDHLNWLLLMCWSSSSTPIQPHFISSAQISFCCLCLPSFSVTTYSSQW